MPKKKKKYRFDPNPELKGLPRTTKELEEMFSKDAYCHTLHTEISALRKRIDLAQAKLIDNEIKLNAQAVELTQLKARCEMFRTDRDAALYTLSVVLTDQRLASNPDVGR